MEQGQIQRTLGSHGLSGLMGHSAEDTADRYDPLLSLQESSQETYESPKPLET